MGDPVHDIQYCAHGAKQPRHAVDVVTPGSAALATFHSGINGIAAEDSGGRQSAGHEKQKARRPAQAPGFLYGWR